MIRKTAIITAASITGIIIAGGAAVGANIGLLNAADDGNLGELSAIAPIMTPSGEPVASLTPAAEVATSTGSSQSFTVDVAGEVEIDADGTGLHLGDVRTNQGWSWQQAPTTDGTVVVSFSTNGDQLVFTATKNDDGMISARADRLNLTSAEPPALATTGSSPRHVDDDSDEYEYEYDDHGYDDHGYEGRDEDD